MEEQILQILQKLDKKIDGMQNQIDALQIKTDTRFDKIQNQVEQISNRQFVFEHEYGTKIDAIFDAVTMELDKNLEKSEKIRNLEKRADRHDVAMFGYEKRISKLELNR